MLSAGRALRCAIAGDRHSHPEGYQSGGLGRIGQRVLATIRMESLKRIGGA